ncbi:MAG: AraC family transcriptional regulator [Pseudomonas sp.]
MDSLSRLLALYPLSTTLDIRCRFGAPWVLEQAPLPTGVAPYHLVVAGTARLDAAGHKGMVLNSGDIVIFPRGGAVRLYAEGSGEPGPLHELSQPQAITYFSNSGNGAVTDILCGQFEFDPGQANTLLSALPEIVLVRSDGREDFNGLQSLITMLRHETETLRPGASAVVSQLSSALFALVIRAWLEQAESVRGLFALLVERRLQEVLQAILEAPGKQWSLERMAATAHMSRATFARLFYTVAGTTPATILMQIRMTQAALWLTQDKLSVGGVGEAVGYQSEAAFNRVFKRHFGIGPGLYRRQSRHVTSRHVVGTPAGLIKIGKFGLTL